MRLRYPLLLLVLVVTLRYHSQAVWGYHHDPALTWQRVETYTLVCHNLLAVSVLAALTLLFLDVKSRRRA